MCRLRRPRVFAGPLRHRSFRSFLLIETIGNSGIWTIKTALAWALLAVSDSAIVVGLLQTLLLLPIPPAALVSGALTDRAGPRWVMVAGWAAMGLIAVGIALLQPGSGYTLWALVLAGALGFANGLYIVPAQFYAMRAVPAHEMGAAIAISSASAGPARVIGGAFGGLLLTALGTGPTLILGASMALVAAALSSRLRTLDARGPVTDPRLGIAEGIRATRRRPEAVAVVWIGCAAGAFTFTYLALLPVVVQDVLGGGAAELGLLTAAGGVGSVAVAVGIDPLARAVGHGRLIVLCLVLSGLGIAALGTVSSTPLSIALSAILVATSIGLVQISLFALQTLVPLAVQGRVLAAYNSALYATLAVSGVASGMLTEAVGVSVTMATFGGLAVVAAATIVRRWPILLAFRLSQMPSAFRKQDDPASQ